MAKDKNGNDEKVNFHEGHRERVRKRLLADPDMKTFSPHEILEYLLFYGVQRKDTNELAHKLIRSFGSLSAVFDADINDLIAYPELPERAAFLIKSILPITDAYLKDSKKETALIDTYSDVINYYNNSSISMNPKEEQVSSIFLDINGRVRNFAQISKGGGTSTSIDIPKLYRLSSACKASKVIIFHNHPGDNMYPSFNDLVTTNVIIITLASLDITLTDHIIRGNSGKYFSFYNNRILDDLIEVCAPFINAEQYKYGRRSLVNDDLSNNVILGEVETAKLKEEIRGMYNNEKYKSFMNDAMEKLKMERKKN